jgi:hypothetical protein
LLALKAWVTDVMEADRLDTLIAYYLSLRHRDTPGMGCYLAALASEAGRSTPGAGLREYLATLRK